MSSLPTTPYNCIIIWMLKSYSYGIHVAVISVACRVSVISNGAGCETNNETLDVEPSLPENPALLKPTK